MRRFLTCLLILSFVLLFVPASSQAFVSKKAREAKRAEALEMLQKRFEWWPTDAKPGVVKDDERGGYWWWPTTPGKVQPWGNRGYVYVYRIIFDYRADELPPPKPQELRPSLLVRKIVRNVKVYFDFDKAALRGDAIPILDDAVYLLKKNPETNILITGNADIRGTESYNKKLARQRSEAVQDYMLEAGIAGDRIRVVSRGKLDAIAPVTDLVGMQKDRSAQFMVADVQEVMLPFEGPPSGPDVRSMGEGKYVVEETEQVESAVRVSTREYLVQEGDTLSGIAERELGSWHRWEYLYELNKDRIKHPDKLKPGQKIIIPVE